MVDGGELHHASSKMMFSMMGISTGIAVVGIFLAYVMYIRIPDLPAKLAGSFKLAYKIVYNKYIFSV